MVFVLLNTHSIHTLYPHMHVYIHTEIHIHISPCFLIKNEKNPNCSALIFIVHNFLPIIFMTFFFNVVTITADHNLFSWLQINETNYCGIRV